MTHAGGRRKGQIPVHTTVYRHVIERIDDRRVLLDCGHVFKTKEPRYPLPKRRAGCAACWKIQQSPPTGLKNFWFAIIGRRLCRTFRTGEFMYESDIEKTNHSHARDLYLVRAETLEAAKRALRLSPHGPNFQAEITTCRGLTLSPSSQPTVRSGYRSRLRARPEVLRLLSTTPRSSPSSV